MNKTILIIFALLFFASCYSEDKDIRIIKNIYLTHNGDDPGSGFDVAMKTDENNYEVLINGEEIRNVYTDSTKILMKTVFNKGDTAFYKIKLNADTTKRPVVTSISRKLFDRLLSDCSGCKKLKFSLKL